MTGTRHVHAGAGGGGGGVSGVGDGLGSVGAGDYRWSTGNGGLALRHPPACSGACPWAWSRQSGSDSAGGVTTIAGTMGATAAGDAVTGVGFVGRWVLMATAPTLTVPATMTVIAAAVTLSAMLIGRLGDDRRRGHLERGLLRRRGRADHHVVRGLPELADEAREAERRQQDDRGQRRHAATLAAVLPRAPEAPLRPMDQGLGLLGRHAHGLGRSPRASAPRTPGAPAPHGGDRGWTTASCGSPLDRAPARRPRRCPPSARRCNPGSSEMVGEGRVPLGTTGARADHVQRHVGGDARYPRLELVATVEPAETPVDTEHRLLDGFVGLLAILEDAVADLSPTGRGT